MERSEASLRLSSREVALRSRLSSPDLNYDTSYKAFSHYTGHRDTIGQGRIYNTALASMQLTSVMAAKEHARIDDLLACPGGAYYLSEFEQKKVEVDRITATVRSMVEEKVLAGMKILDIGCGPFPSFARCARALGAKVYTMDVVVHPEQFWGTEEFLAVHKEEEAAHHLTYGINTDGAEELLRELTGGELDVVTWSHLTSEWKMDTLKAMDVKRLRSRTMSLLKENGWLIPLPPENEITTMQRKDIAP